MVNNDSSIFEFRITDSIWGDTQHLFLVIKHIKDLGYIWLKVIDFWNNAWSTS